MTVGEAAAWMVHDSRVQGLKGAFLRMPDASLPVVCVCVSLLCSQLIACKTSTPIRAIHEVSCP